MSKNIKMTQSEFDILIVYAFRYALGRRSAAVSDVADLIKKYWNKVDSFTKILISNEIKEACRTGRAGMQMDEDKWIEVLKMCDNDLVETGD